MTSSDPCQRFESILRLEAAIMGLAADARMEPLREEGMPRFTISQGEFIYRGEVAYETLALEFEMDLHGIAHAHLVSFRDGQSR